MRRVWTAVGVNVVIGIPGIIPIFLAYYFLSNGPLADIGWTSREPTENDGTLVLGMFLGPTLLCAGGGWLLANWWPEPSTRGSAEPVWDGQRVGGTRPVPLPDAPSRQATRSSPELSPAVN